MTDQPRPTVNIRPLQPTDVPTLLGLVDALADYEKLPRPDAAAHERLAADATSDPPRFEVLLVEVNGEVVGCAVFFMTYSTFRAQPSLYLEDLFVRPEARGLGAGKALLQACAAEAVRRQCGRMDWQVLGWNTPSIEFYRRLGARHVNEWNYFRLDDDALQRLGGA